MTAYFDRDTNTIEGFLTIRDSNETTIIHRIEVRSGQRGHTHTDNESGKSPIPFGHWWLWLNPYNRDQLPGATGVGEFYPIGSHDNPTVIQGDGFTRIGIGLHQENAIPGSAGCIVVVKVDDWERVKECLKGFRDEGLTKIQLTVL